MAELQPLRHDNYGPQLNALAAVLVVLSGAFLLVRVLLKRRQRCRLWWDDYVLILAWVRLCCPRSGCSGGRDLTGQVTFLAVALTTFVLVSFGVGKHVWELSIEDIFKLAPLGNINAFLTILGSAWSKTSFALTLLRLPIGNLRYFVWFIIVSMNLLLYISAASLWFGCRPPAPGQPAATNCLPVDLVLWYGVIAGGMLASRPHSSCRQLIDVGYSAAVDFTLALLPWRILWHLQMERKEKAGVLVAMSMGALYVVPSSPKPPPAKIPTDVCSAGMASIMKTVKIPSLSSFDISKYVHRAESALLIGIVAVDGIQQTAWGMTEIAVTIMAACIPILRALWKRNLRGELPLGSVDGRAAETCESTVEVNYHSGRVSHLVTLASRQ